MDNNLCTSIEISKSFDGTSLGSCWINFGGKTTHRVNSGFDGYTLTRPSQGRAM